MQFSDVLKYCLRRNVVEHLHINDTSDVKVHVMIVLFIAKSDEYMLA